MIIRTVDMGLARFLGIKNMEGEIVIKRWEDLDGEVSSYRLYSTFNLDTFPLEYNLPTGFPFIFFLILHP